MTHVNANNILRRGKGSQKSMFQQNPNTGRQEVPFTKDKRETPQTPTRSQGRTPIHIVAMANRFPAND